MVRRKKILIGTVIFFILNVLAWAGFYIKSSELFNCFFINYSNNFTEIKENLYISLDTPETLQDSIIAALDKADKRVCSFWNVNQRAGNPVIIFCYSKDMLTSYSRNNFIVTYKTPLKCFIIFYRDYIDLDILSHELSHTEFCSRIGYFKNSKIPVWFDEGLAMQVDYREEYSEEKYNELKDSATMKVDLSTISKAGEFYAGNYYYHFILAKHEVSSWIKGMKPETLNSFIY
jgi:hypothetical protein